MTYNDWRDELKNNLLNVSEGERRRVLDYYAEAYADRRAAGFSEHEIIEGFGAPYDAAQAILDDGGYDEPPRRERRDRRDEYFDEPRYEQNNAHYSQNDARFRQQKASTAPAKSEEKRSNNGATTLLLIIVFLVLLGPIFGLIMAAVGITIALIVGPVAAAGTGGAYIVQGATSMISSLSFAGLDILGVGIILLGAAIALFPLCIKLVKILWKVYGMIFRAVRDLVRGN